MRLFQINEDDLAELERILPDLHETMKVAGERYDNTARTKLRVVKRIISDVRWFYGPHEHVNVIPANGGDALDGGGGK